MLQGRLISAVIALHHELRLCFGINMCSDIGVSVSVSVSLHAGFPALWPQHGYHENSMTGDITAAV